jgi:hypothetical protein
VGVPAPPSAALPDTRVSAAPRGPIGYGSCPPAAPGQIRLRIPPPVYKVGHRGSYIHTSLGSPIRGQPKHILGGWLVTRDTPAGREPLQAFICSRARDGARFQSRLCAAAALTGGTGPSRAAVNSYPAEGLAATISPRPSFQHAFPRAHFSQCAGSSRAAAAAAAAAGLLLLGCCCWAAAAGLLLLGCCCWAAAAGLLLPRHGSGARLGTAVVSPGTAEVGPPTLPQPPPAYVSDIFLF